MLAALTLCLDVLLPALAMAGDASQPTALCVPDGYQTIRLNQDGVPPPAQQKHDCFGCAVHHGFGSFVATIPTVSAATVPDSSSAIRPERASQRSATNKRSCYPRGPPHLS